MDNEYLDKDKVGAQEALKAAKEKKQAKRTRQKIEKKPSAFVQILNGDFLTKEFMLGNLSFIFFVCPLHSLFNIL